jgi:hypothetical protein
MQLHSHVCSLLVLVSVFGCGSSPAAESTDAATATDADAATAADVESETTLNSDAASGGCPSTVKAAEDACQGTPAYAQPGTVCTYPECAADFATGSVTTVTCVRFEIPYHLTTTTPCSVVSGPSGCPVAYPLSDKSIVPRCLEVGRGCTYDLCATEGRHAVVACMPEKRYASGATPSSWSETGSTACD